MIQEINGKFCIISHTTEANLGCYDTKEEAEARLEEIKQFVKEESEPAIQFSKKSIKMPILPSKPSMTVDGRPVPQELIDSILAYDASKRTAIVKLDKQHAHGKHDGLQNNTVLGRITKTYQEGEHIYAEAQPQKGFENLLPLLAGEDGAFPDRSIEADYLELTPGEKTLWLEAVALCGTQRPALSLPAVSFTSNKTNSYHISLTGGEPMPDPKQPEEKITLTKEELDAEFSKRESSLREEFTKKNTDLQERLDRKDLEVWIQSAKMLRKMPADQRDNVVNFALALKPNEETKVAFSMGKETKEISLFEAFKSFVESLPDKLPEAKEKAGDYPKEFTAVPDSPASANAAITQFATENKIDTTKMEGFTKAETGARKQWPDLFDVRRQGVN